MTDIGNFSIVRRNPNKEVYAIYKPGDFEYDYIASSIYLALEALRHEDAQNCLAHLVLGCERSWEGPSDICGGDLGRARGVVDSFLTNITAMFPLVAVDEGIQSPACLGYHPRGVWEGEDLNQFDPRKQAVNLNAERVDAVVSGDYQRQKTFQFLLAATFMHEIGPHLLITAVGQGRKFTPPHITAPGFTHEDRSVGESGRWFEKRLFGGTLELVRDPNQDNGQPGIPYICDETTGKRIDRSVITAFFRYQFSFPLVTDDQPSEDFKTLERIGMPASAASSDFDRLLSPPDAQMQVGSRKEGGDRFMSARGLTAEILAGYNIKLSALRRIPMHPEERLTAIA